MLSYLAREVIGLCSITTSTPLWAIGLGICTLLHLITFATIRHQ
jgi:hypothetical protein